MLKGSLDEVVTRFLERITTTKANAIRGEIFMTGTAELLSPSHLFFLTKFNKVNQDIGFWGASKKREKFVNFFFRGHALILSDLLQATQHIDSRNGEECIENNSTHSRRKFSTFCQSKHDDDVMRHLHGVYQMVNFVHFFCWKVHKLRDS